MTQRVFDIENEKDMQDLWYILPDWVSLIKRADKSYNYDSLFSKDSGFAKDCCIFKINWHDKTEITRPIQEATSEDIGKLCRFWNDEESYIGILASITNMGSTTYYRMNSPCYEDLDFLHCHRLTKQEIEGLCL